MLESVDSVGESRAIDLRRRAEPLVVRGPADLTIGKLEERVHPIDIARHQEFVWSISKRGGDNETVSRAGRPSRSQPSAMDNNGI